MLRLKLTVVGAAAAAAVAAACTLSLVATHCDEISGARSPG